MKDNEERRKERQKIYQTAEWKNLQKSYLSSHPICEDCLRELKNGKECDPELATEIHHIKSPFSDNISEVEKYQRAYDYYNLAALCSYHHHLRHGTTRTKEQKESYKLL